MEDFDTHIPNPKELPPEYFEASTMVINEIMSQRPHKTALDQYAVQNVFDLLNKQFNNEVDPKLFRGLS